MGKVGGGLGEEGNEIQSSTGSSPRGGFGYSCQPLPASLQPFLRNTWEDRDFRLWAEEGAGARKGRIGRIEKKRTENSAEERKRARACG